MAIIVKKAATLKLGDWVRAEVSPGVFLVGVLVVVSPKFSLMAGTGAWLDISKCVPLPGSLVKEILRAR